MDPSKLTGLGKVGGVPGIALGAVVLVVGAALAYTGILPEGWRGPVLTIAIVGAVLLAILPLVRVQRASTQGKASAAQNRGGFVQRAETKGDNSPAKNE